MNNPRHSVKVQTDPDTGDSYISIEDMLKNTNTKSEEVCYYILKQYGGVIKVTLLDKDKKEIIVKDK